MLAASARWLLYEWAEARPGRRIEPAAISNQPLYPNLRSAAPAAGLQRRLSSGLKSPLARRVGNMRYELGYFQVVIVAIRRAGARRAAPCGGDDTSITFAPPTERSRR